MKRATLRWRWLGSVAGAVAGIALGLGISWGLFPRLPRHADLEDLADTYRADLVDMVGEAYLAQGDPLASVELLSSLGYDDFIGIVVERFDIASQSGSSASRRRGLARLANALGAHDPGILAYVATPVESGVEPTRVVPSETVALPTVTSTATRTSTMTPTATATRTPSPTAQTRSLGYRARVIRLDPDDELALPGSVIVRVLDRAGRGIPGIRVRVEWAGGSGRIVTGLHPDRDRGYADLRMLSGVAYSLYVEGHPSAMAKLEPDAADGGMMAWQVVFQQQ